MKAHKRSYIYRISRNPTVGILQNTPDALRKDKTTDSFFVTGWGLSLALEEVEPPPFDRNGSPELETVKSPRTIITSNSDDDDDDDDDVVICTSFTR